MDYEGSTFIPVYTGLFVISFLLSRGSLQACLYILIAARLCSYLLSHRNLPEAAVRRLLGEMRVIGHRGCTVEAPENTLAAIREAHNNGVAGIEIDVEFTSDGHPVIIHDDTVDRTTDGTGPVSSFTLAELRQLDPAAKHPFKENFQGELIPTLEEALLLAKDLHLVVFLDIKGDYPFRVAQALSDLYEKDPGLFDRVAICSFFPRIIYTVRWYLPQLVTGLTHRPNLLSAYDSKGSRPKYGTGWMQTAVQVADFLWEKIFYHVCFPLCANSLFLMNGGVASESEVNYWSKRGVTTLVWTVNNINEKRFLRYNLDVAYMTDIVSPDKNNF